MMPRVEQWLKGLRAAKPFDRQPHGAALIRAANLSGIRVNVLSPDECLWSGKAINLIWIPDVADLAHEVAHHLLSHPDNRDLKNFGWFSAPAGPWAKENNDIEVRRRPSPYLSHKEVLNDEEESFASALGILIERALDADWRVSTHEHSWTDNWGDFWRIARSLRRTGLVGRDFTPVFLEPLRARRRS
jgi:hypothetical protein